MIRNKKYSPQDLIDKFSELLPKGMSDDSLNAFVFLEALLVNSYNNYFNRESFKALIYRKNTGEISCYAKSRLDITNEQFIAHLQSIGRHRFYDRVSIDYLLNKIELMDDFLIK